MTRLMKMLTEPLSALCGLRNPFGLLLPCLILPSHVAAEKLDVTKDYHSYANTTQVTVTHLALDLAVDFDKKQLKGFVVHDLHIKTQDASTLMLDSRDLKISQVQCLGKKEKFETCKHKVYAPHPALGSKVEIAITPETRKVKVFYATRPSASGLQWLDPIQTAGKKHPFLFSQAQAIHARSFIPLQDTPQVRVTYDAVIRTPKALRAVMSANNDGAAPLDGVFEFSMPQAIPSYLIALAVGDLKFKAMGRRTGVYAEPDILEAAAEEFEDTESMLEVTEKKFGPYRWGRYDLLILPPSFPFGGMENPRLSFITPTVIAGDKSLVALIAHELAHSWSGNAVTNATWRDLWLNEGFTTYLTYRIMEIVYGRDRFNMESVLGFQDLEQAVAKVDEKDQSLAIDVRGRDPDEAFSNIPYEKGAYLLREIESKIGRKAFDKFLKQYFKDYTFKSLHTEEFLTYLDKNLVQKYPKKLNMARIHEWVYKSGFPVDTPRPSSDAFTKIDKQVTQWLGKKINAKQIKADKWTVHEWLYFLNKLPEKLSTAQLVSLDKTFALTQSRNNEIAHLWLLMAIRNEYQPAYARLEKYLISIGRRKLITPLYEALVKTEKGKAFAERVYQRARPGYHPLAQGTVDKIISSAGDKGPV